MTIYEQDVAEFLAAFRGLDVQSVKVAYRQMVMIHHPDRGGDTEVMKALNEAYHISLKSAHGTTSVDEMGAEHTYRYNAEVEQAIMDKIAELLKALPDDADVEIDIIGLWIWVTGDTRPHKSVLGKKGCGFRWHSKRVAWYWKPYRSRSRYNPNRSLDDLRQTYGGRRVGRDHQGQGQSQDDRPRLA